MRTEIQTCLHVMNEVFILYKPLMYKTMITVVIVVVVYFNGSVV